MITFLVMQLILIAYDITSEYIIMPVSVEKREVNLNVMIKNTMIFWLSKLHIF